MLRKFGFHLPMVRFEENTGANQGSGSNGLSSFLAARGDNQQAPAPSADGAIPQDNTEPPADNAPAPFVMPDKYQGKTSEELVQAALELESRVGELSSASTRADELENLLYQIMQSSQNSGQGQAPPTEESLISDQEAVDLFKDPKGTLNNILKRLISTSVERSRDQITREEEVARTKADMRNNFYSSYEDLKGAEIVVGHISAMVQRSNPNIHPMKLFPEIAKRSREELSKLRGTAPLPGNNLTPADNQSRIPDANPNVNTKHINSLLERHNRR